MRTIVYKGYQILETTPAELQRGFRWKVNPSLVGALSSARMPLFYQLPAAKAYIREELLEERPFNDDEGGAS